LKVFAAAANFLTVIHDVYSIDERHPHREDGEGHEVSDILTLKFVMFVLLCLFSQPWQIFYRPLLWGRRLILSSRQDAKNAKKVSYFLGALCAFARVTLPSAALLVAAPPR
jgi:hypothetical protein